MAEVKKPVAVAPASAEKKAEPVAAVKAAPVAAKPAVKKPAVKKAAAKPAVKKAATKKVAVKASIQLEFDGGNIKVDVDKLASRAAKDYKKNFKADAKKIEIYINADERKIYYVADGNSGSFDA